MDQRPEHARSALSTINDKISRYGELPDRTVLLIIEAHP